MKVRIRKPHTHAGQLTAVDDELDLPDKAAAFAISAGSAVPVTSRPRGKKRVRNTQENQPADQADP